MTPKEYFSINGRLRRKHYLIIYGAALVVVLFIGLLQEALEVRLSFLMYLLVGAIIPPSVRRLHDIGYSGWLMIGVVCVPLAFLLLLAAPGEPGANAYGTNPKPTGG